MPVASDEIRTEHLILRRATMDDVASMHAIMSNPVAMRYWSTPPHSEVVETERWMASMVGADPAASDDFIVTLEGAGFIETGRASGTWQVGDELCDSVYLRLAF